MALLLLIKEGPQVIAGVPEWFSVQTNIPSLVYYTFDGTEPTTSSKLVLDDSKIYSPDIFEFTIKIKAIAGRLSSEIWEETYKRKSVSPQNRVEQGEGISVILSGQEVIDSVEVNADGESTKKTAVPFIDLEIKSTEKTKEGETYPKGETSISFVNFALELRNSFFESKKYKSDVSDINFDPKAEYILIDGSTQSAQSAQQVKIINRPQSTLAPVHDFNDDKKSQSPVFSNLVRYFVNKEGYAVFYYFDSRENRWLESAQKFDGKVGLNLSESTINTFVYPWVKDRSYSNLF